MKKPFMSYYEHIAKLATVANKRTLFLAHLLHRMEFDDENRIMYVDTPPMVKREILRDIGAESKNPLLLASQYLSTLQKAGLIKSVGSSRYIIDPSSYSYGKYISKSLREKTAVIYNTGVYEIYSEGEVQAYIIDNDGERIDL
jgi:hypothetical protein